MNSTTRALCPARKQRYLYALTFESLRPSKLGVMSGTCPRGFQDLLKKAMHKIAAQIKEGKSLVLVIATYAIGALLLKYMCDWSSINKKYVKKVGFFEITNKKWKSRMQYVRGDNYGLDTHDMSGKVVVCDETEKSLDMSSDSKDNPYHVMTGWSCLHVVLYMFLGFLSPKYWWLMLIISVVWELFEFQQPQDCHDLLDLGWNSTGLLIGMGLRKVLLK